MPNVALIFHLFLADDESKHVLLLYFTFFQLYVFLIVMGWIFRYPLIRITQSHPFSRVIKKANHFSTNEMSQQPSVRQNVSIYLHQALLSKFFVWSTEYTQNTILSAICGRHERMGASNRSHK